MIKIEIVYAKPEMQILTELMVEYGTTIKQAIEVSGFLERFPELNQPTLIVGIFSKLVPLNHILKENDRIEIYRPLIIDPKAARMQRVKQKKRSQGK